MAEPRNLDWEGIEAAYRAGFATLRAIGEEFGCSHTAIQRRAARDGWSRDLSAKIAAEAQALVAKNEVAKRVSKISPATEREIVESNASLLAVIAIGQRTSINRNKSLAEKLLDELEAQCNDPALFAQLGEIMASPDERGADKLNDLYRKVIGLPSRIDGAKKLAETLRILVTMEREAYGMDKDKPADTGMSGESVAVLKRLKARLEAEFSH